jgi:NAD(P)-dependent dehydrogenase (short-subunit alcohol dehydrogenase family)
MKSRDRRVVVVTGADAGLGRAIADAFGKCRDRVALIARDKSRLEATAAEIERCGGDALALVADVADVEAVRRAASRVEEELGPIDVWVNNAMVSVLAPFAEIRPEEFRRVTDVNYHGYVYGTRAALDRMVPRDRGVIIQVGSALAYRAIPLQSAYCGSKHAVRGFTQAVRCELLAQRSHVRIGMVQMPALNTPQFEWVLSRLANRPRPVPPVYQPEVGARAVVWMAAHPRRELWVGASTIGAVIATTVAPGALDHYLGRTGMQSQQTDEPADPRQPNNLFEPVEGIYAARGRFDRDAIERSPALWASSHRRLIAALAVAGVAGVAGVAASVSKMTHR